MASKKDISGYKEIQHDLQSKTYQKLYIFHGEESYLKERFIARLKKAVVDEAFEEFNLVEFDGKGLAAQELYDAVESYPAFAERKMVIVKDLDIFKSSADMQEVILKIIEDLPEYICLIFYYDTLEFKPDKRTKLYSIVNKIGSINEFAKMSENELITAITRYVRSVKKEIDRETCQYLLFLCGTSMTTLINEINKAIAHSTVTEIKKYHLDTVCTKALDAVVFDLTDNITNGKFERAIRSLSELIAQKNNEITLFSAISRHMQRIYAAKLYLNAPSVSSKELMEVLGTGSSYYAQKMCDTARKLSLNWLRQSVIICGKTDATLKNSTGNKQKIIEIALLTMASRDRRE